MQAPDLYLEGTGGRREIRPKIGKLLLLLLYEEDSTPLCSLELASYRDDFALLTELGVEVVAASTDSLDSHRNFLKQIKELPFPLLSDPEGVLARALQCWDPSTRRSRRSVFVIDQNGTVVHSTCPYNPSRFDQYEAVFRALGFHE